MIRIEDHPDYGYVTIDGINYAYPLFKVFAEGKLNHPFTIIKREDGMVTARNYHDNFRYALETILQEAGRPTMGYCTEVENVERGRILHDIADLARKALGGL